MLERVYFNFYYLPLFFTSYGICLSLEFVSLGDSLFS